MSCSAATQLHVIHRYDNLSLVCIQDCQDSHTRTIREGALYAHFMTVSVSPFMLTFILLSKRVKQT